MRTELRYALSCAVVLALSAFPVSATGDKAKSSPEHPARATCLQEARGLKGDEHEKFMTQCLKRHGGADENAVHSVALERQQNKMKKCNVEAGSKALKGDERRAFMSACLKG